MSRKTHMKVNLQRTTDAAVWSSEFCKFWASAGFTDNQSNSAIDADHFEALMFEWFSGAIAAGAQGEAKNLQQAVARAEVRGFLWAIENAERICEEESSNTGILYSVPHQSAAVLTVRSRIRSLTRAITAGSNQVV